MTEYAPIFIGGAGRSGTTLLRVMLNAHPNLCSGTEFKFLPSITNVYQQILGQEDILNSYFLTEEEVNQIFARFIKDFFERFRTEKNAARFVEKTPHNVLIMKELLKIYPDARFIHVVRDGRDVASSLVKMKWIGMDGEPLWYVKNLENAAKYWVQVVTKAIEDGSSSNFEGKIKIIRYEDLVLDPVSTMKSILKFIHEPWSEKVLNHTSVNRGFEPKESSTDQVKEKIYSSSMGRWRQAFKEKDKERFKEVAGHLLLQLGYETNFSWS